LACCFFFILQEWIVGLLQICDAIMRNYAIDSFVERVSPLVLGAIPPYRHSDYSIIIVAIMNNMIITDSMLASYCLGWLPGQAFPLLTRRIYCTVFNYAQILVSTFLSRSWQTMVSLRRDCSC